MKQIFCILFFLCSVVDSFGQGNIASQTQPIVEEGKRLYKSERASWYGTDVFLAQFSDREKIGGYFSYLVNNVARCIFFSKGDKVKVIGTISFDTTYNPRTATTDLTERDFTNAERVLYAIRSIALQVINSDTLFKTYDNTSLNLIPIISGGQKKVYVLTGPQNNGVIIFGNDYLLTFDNENKLIKKQQLHKNIIVTNFGEKTEDGNEITGAMHTHLPETGDFITATDICTLLLYEKFTNWKRYSIISDNYLSTWNCETDELTTIKKENIDKIDKDQKTRGKVN